jgi:hypothetical protein
MSEKGSQTLSTIYITKNMRNAFEFIGLSFDQWIKGFDSVEDIFDFVISSPYFDSDSFKFENLNAQNRHRFQRREIFCKFIEYVERIKVSRKIEWNSERDNYLPMIDSYFPEVGLITRISEIKMQEEKQRNTYKKFNGHIVMQQHPYLQGPKLGSSMSSFRQYIEVFEKKPFYDYLEETENQEIMDDFTKFLNSHGNFLKN